MEQKLSYYERNKEKCKAKAKEYIKNNKEKHAKYMKKSHKNNIDKRREYNKNYKNKQYHRDEQVNIKTNYLVMHNLFLKGDKNKMYELIGCNLEDYKQYIEKMLDVNMNWENRGKTWRLVRKKSFREFDLTKQEELKKYFNYKNVVVQRINGITSI